MKEAINSLPRKSPLAFSSSRPFQGLCSDRIASFSELEEIDEEEAEKSTMNAANACTRSRSGSDITEASTSSCSSSCDDKKSSKKWTRREKIGQGAQGSVYRCEEVSTGKQIAAKIINTKEMTAAEVGAIKREVKIIKSLPHRHLVQYLKVSEKAHKLSIYMEYVAGGSLSSKIRKEGPLAMKQIKRFTRQLLQALQFLHENRIAHRDIKCANIFLTSSLNSIKLGDFGAFKEIGSVSVIGGLKGTPHWMAPEVIREQQTNEGWIKADVWSLGCSVLEMITGHSPWQNYSNPLTAMYQIVSSNAIPDIPEDAPEDAKAFLRCCLQRNPDDRPDTTQLLAHSFVQRTSDSEKSSRRRRSEPDDFVEDEEEEEAPPTKVQQDEEDHCQEQQQQQRKREKDCSSENLSPPRSIPERHILQAKPVSKLQKPSKILKPRKLSCLTDRKFPSSSDLKYQTEDDEEMFFLEPEIIIKAVKMAPLNAPTSRLKIPTKFAPSSTNQDKEIGPMARQPFGGRLERIASTSSLAISPHLDKTSGLTLDPIKLRRVSTAPAQQQRIQMILPLLPDEKNLEKFKLPPLSVRILPQV